MTTHNIAVLAGDGIGPEVMQQAHKVLDAVSKKHNFTLNCKDYAVGGYAIDTCGEALPDETIWQVAKRYEVDIPHLCYSPEPGYRADGNCRACVVEIEGYRPPEK